MRKSDAEPVIRRLCHTWRQDEGHRLTPAGALSFGDFWGWLQAYYPTYVNFRSRASARYDVELWFDQEFGQAGLR